MNISNKIKTNPIILIRNIFIRYNLIICIVLVGGALMYTTLTIASVLAQPASTNNPTSTVFDQTTINKLNQHETSTNNTNYNNLPQGRINPFFE